MKKIIITFVTVLVICTLLFTGCNSYGYDIPSADSFDLTGASGSGVSGTPALSFPALLQNSDAPLALEDIVTSVSNEEEKWSDNYYTITLSIAENADGKMVERRNTLTYTNAVTSEDDRPSNWADFVYISQAMPKEIYEADYQYGCKKVSTMQNFDNNARPYDFVVDGAEWIRFKLFAFLRYTYLQTGGRVKLEFTYDTSFNYQTDDFGGGMVIRAKVKVSECTLTTPATLSDLLNAQVGNDTLINVFNSTGYKLGIKPIQNISLSNGATAWCDIQIGVPKVSPADNGLWAYMLYYYNQI